MTGLELVNEAPDHLRAYIPGWYRNWPDTLIEVALTLGPPLVLAARRGWRHGRGRLADRLWFRLRFPPRREHIVVRAYRPGA